MSMGLVNWICLFFSHLIHLLLLFVALLLCYFICCSIALLLCFMLLLKYKLPNTIKCGESEPNSHLEMLF